MSVFLFVDARISKALRATAASSRIALLLILLGTSGLCYGQSDPSPSRVAGVPTQQTNPAALGMHLGPATPEDFAKLAGSRFSAVEFLRAPGAENFAPPYTSPSASSPFSYQKEQSPYSGAPGSGRHGSTYVPMDSWIYPALDRLSALGFIPAQSVAIRPWTRQECLRQIDQADDQLHSPDWSDLLRREVLLLLRDLRKELAGASDEQGIVFESAYVRYGTIAGPALTDGFHIGQTWSNDFGRPLGRGNSVIAGLSARATHGRFFLYDRQELQQSPGAPGLTASQANLFNNLDIVPFGPPGPAPFVATPSSAAYLRQRPLELYAGAVFAGNALSFGKQSLYWGPGTTGPLSFSINAEPTYNLRFDATHPHPLPFFPELGTYRFDFVFGKLSGHKSPARPYFNGQKVDFNLGQNLELSFTRWSILWGVGHPMTLRSLKDNLFSSNSTGTNFLYGDRSDPGDRKSGFDFRLHVPGLSQLLTIYADSYADDDLSPLAAPRRNVWNPGIYVTRLPYLPHMDLRLEMASSEELSRDEGGLRFFINNQYRDANTNKGFLLGNAVGRDARVFESRTGYWFSSRTRVEAGYRQDKGGLKYLAGGSTISDGFMNASYAFAPDWDAKVFVQYERFLVPSFIAGSQHNESGWFQITWTPKLHYPDR